MQVEDKLGHQNIKTTVVMESVIVNLGLPAVIWVYAAIFFAMVVEGPVATIASASLAAAGFFNIWIVLILSILGDVFGDIILYSLGRFGGVALARGFLSRVGITEDRLHGTERFFSKYGGRTIFLVKSTTGLCWVTFFAAGVAKMKFSTFLYFSLLGGVVWSGMLVFAGWSFGYLWREIADTIRHAGWIVLGVAILVFVLFTLFRRRAAQRIMKESE